MRCTSDFLVLNIVTVIYSENKIQPHSRKKNSTDWLTNWLTHIYLKLPAVAGGVREAKDLPGSLRLPGVWTRMFHFFGTRQSNFIATRLFHFFASSLFYFLILERLGPTLLFSNLLKEKKKKTPSYYFWFLSYCINTIHKSHWETKIILLAFAGDAKFVGGGDRPKK